MTWEQNKTANKEAIKISDVFDQEYWKAGFWHNLHQLIDRFARFMGARKEPNYAKLLDMV